MEQRIVNECDSGGIGMNEGEVLRIASTDTPHFNSALRTS